MGKDLILTEDQYPLPTKRPEVKRLIGNMIPAIDYFLNNILIPRDLKFNRHDVNVLKRYIEQKFMSWADFPYHAISVALMSGWLNVKTAKSANYLQYIVRVYEINTEEETMLLSFASESKDQISGFETKCLYTWYVC